MVDIDVIGVTVIGVFNMVCFGVIFLVGGAIWSSNGSLFIELFVFKFVLDGVGV